ncbi:IQ domain-containing protein C [Tachyglossus aculeatus]|uniref:IQ domain-containing protein C n=1 Tax=Tachyglossus aculeatus TaxID=9261 RepID=UPI0018F3E156|nr:IQ domain-containing protein C [Tachyglossus aculeatus]
MTYIGGAGAGLGRCHGDEEGGARSDDVCRRPGCGVMEAEELVRRVTALQARVRGWLVRRRFRSLREDYEELVRAIEGHGDLLRWRGRAIPRPVFLQQKVKTKPVGAPEVVSQVESGPGGGQDQPRAPLDEEPERDCADRSHGETPAQLPRERHSPNRGGARGPDPGPGDLSSWERSRSGAPKDPGSEANLSDASSVWSSATWETEAADPRAGGDRGSYPGSQLPSDLPQLQRHRSHLAMELLWLQQAIASRKELFKPRRKAYWRWAWWPRRPGELKTDIPARPRPAQRVSAVEETGPDALHHPRVEERRPADATAAPAAAAAARRSSRPPALGGAAPPAQRPRRPARPARAQALYAGRGPHLR